MLWLSAFHLDNRPLYFDHMSLRMCPFIHPFFFSVFRFTSCCDRGLTLWPEHPLLPSTHPRTLPTSPNPPHPPPLHLFLSPAHSYVAAHHAASHLINVIDSVVRALVPDQHPPLPLFWGGGGPGGGGAGGGGRGGDVGWAGAGRHWLSSAWWHTQPGAPSHTDGSRINEGHGEHELRHASLHPDPTKRSATDKYSARSLPALCYRAQTLLCKKRDLEVPRSEGFQTKNLAKRYPKNV